MHDQTATPDSNAQSVKAAAAIKVTGEEMDVLRSARRDGYVAADLFRQGDFSEEGFLLFGRLEVMCLKGLLRFVDRVGDAERGPSDVRMVFAPSDAGLASA